MIRFRSLALGLLLLTGCASATLPRTDASSSADATGSDGAASAESSVGADAAGSCALPNGGQCAVGQSCPAGDGCNLCSCSSTGVLACTARACLQTCTSPTDCPAGTTCAGAAGCGVPWTCQPIHPCTGDVALFCDCAGVTFTASGSCPTRPYAHAGPCETPDAGACLANGTLCTSNESCCSGFCPQRGAPVSTCAPAPPAMVPCGTSLCREGFEYCETQYSDTPSPDSQRCYPLPTVCGTELTCGCVPTRGCSCTSASGSQLVLRCPGG